MDPKGKNVMVDEELQPGVSGCTGFDEVGATIMNTDDGGGIWEIDVESQHQNLLNEMNDDRHLLFGDLFPNMPDFPCMSSSSSSSSKPAPVKAISWAASTSSASSASSSTASASSWAVLNQLEGYGYGNGNWLEKSEGFPAVMTEAGGVGGSWTADGSGSFDCMDLLESYGYTDLIDGNEAWDPNSIFVHNHPEFMGTEVVEGGEMRHGGGSGGGDGEKNMGELESVFLEWLKSNKESISGEDMRNITLKTATIECASNRLGSSPEGKKQLVQLILDWVQQYRLHKNNSGGFDGFDNGGGVGGSGSGGEFLTTTNPTPNGHYAMQYFQVPPSPTATTLPTWVQTGHEVSNGFAPEPWMYMAADEMGMMKPVPTFSYMGGKYNSDMNYTQLNPYKNAGSGDYQVLDSTQSWNSSQITMDASQYTNQFPDMGNNYAPQVMQFQPCYPSQYQYNPAVNYFVRGGDEQQVVMNFSSSATKEARKRRMDSQRRTYSHPHHQSRSNQNSHQNPTPTDHHAQAMLGNGSATLYGGNWSYWPAPPPTATHLPLPMQAPLQPSATQPQVLQGLRTGKNLRFLFQKVLTPCDVGSLGRIVLPKRLAENSFPGLASRDGMTICMEDIATSKVWKMRFRASGVGQTTKTSPNNKNRMYHLENTGDFVKENGLKEGDFIVIFSQNGKYLIRGVKVRQPPTPSPKPAASAKSEGKRNSKRRSTSQSAKTSAASSSKEPAT